ncbi:MAG: hypothetical protein QW165_00230 [Candidatus Woesearchaeota archaeon]
MVQKTVIALVVIVLLVAVIVSAAYRYTYWPPRYRYYYTYYPVQYYPYPVSYPLYMYPYYYSPLSAEYMFRYGTPEVQVSYPAAVQETAPRGSVGQLCGLVDSKAYGCYYGMVCDYTATGKPGIGVCTSQ